MSTLELRGSRKSGHTTLSRNHHDLSGTDREYIGSLPDESAEALRHGGSIQVALREEAGPNEAPWILEVIREGQTLPGTLLSDERLAILTAERDRIPVTVEGGELAHRKRALMRTREDLAGAETRVTDLRAKIIGIEQEIREMTGLSEENRLTTADGKYELSWQTDGPGRVKRHEEPWRELGPGSLPIRLAEELSDLRDRIAAAGGDPLEPVSATRYRPGPEPLWGRDPSRNIASQIERLTQAYEGPAVLEALGPRILPRHAVQAEMDRIAEAGFGASLRNMRDPKSHIRHCVRGDRFSQHETAIRSDRYDHPVLVCPNRNLEYVRRFLIVAGEVAAETPYRFCAETPTDLLIPDAWRLQAEDFMSPLTEEDPVWRDLQRAEADRLLDRFPLRSGAIDVGIRITADGEVTPHVEGVIAAPPGAFDTFYADVRTYAEAVAENLTVLEPSLAEPEGLEL